MPDHVANYRGPIPPRWPLRGSGPTEPVRPAGHRSRVQAACDAAPGATDRAVRAHPLISNVRVRIGRTRFVERCGGDELSCCAGSGSGSSSYPSCGFDAEIRKIVCTTSDVQHVFWDSRIRASSRRVAAITGGGGAGSSSGEREGTAPGAQSHGGSCQMISGESSWPHVRASLPLSRREV